MTLSSIDSYSQSKFVAEINSNWVFKQEDKVSWYPATVPGCVHTDLLKNKVITEPYYRVNEKDIQWVDKKNWIYKTKFIVDKETQLKQTILLEFKGLDTYAKVLFNGVQILEANNMFREWSADIKRLINKTGENTLEIFFESPINKTIPLFDSLSFQYPAPNDQSELGGVGNKKVSIFTRKAGYQYGWDWGPRFVTSGIWRPIYLVAYDNLKLNNVAYTTKSIDNDSAVISANVEMQTKDITDANIEFWVNGFLASSTDVTFNSSVSTKNISFSIKSPKLWWSNGLGEPYMYNIKCIVKRPNKVFDQKEIKFGVRTIELVHEKDATGKSFYFKLNGIPVFMKGANYIPLDNFPSRITKDRYEKAIQSAVDANMNMLRVWGGGIYENDVFYDLCDEKGILIWQDMMFACSLYPGDDAFLDNVRHEIIDNVKRLQNHASIALWCGNNEIHTAWNGWGWKPEFEKKSPELAQKLWNDYDKLFNKLIPSVLLSIDPQRFYWPSSPMASKDIKAGDLNSGDIHYWDVWHFGKPFKEYENNVGRFMSEYGFQSFPELKTVDEYTVPTDRKIESEVMMSHQRHPRGNQLINTYLGYYYKTPKDFENFLYVGQVLQAEGIKIAVEAHRRAKPTCMGTLYWQLNDCWPVASWSSTDYYGRWKALHYFVKKAYAPILISTKAENTKADIYFVSDLLANKTVIANCKIIDFEGKVLWEKNKELEIAANTSTKVSIDYSKIDVNDKVKESAMLVISVKDEAKINPCYVYFKDIKDLQLPKPTITNTVTQTKTGYVVTVTSDKLAKNIYLQTEKNGYFTDNYFDLLPGESKTVEFKSQSFGFTSKNLKISTIVDSF